MYFFAPVILCYNLAMNRKIITTNRKAYHDFLISEKYIAGIVLTGTEIKSIRNGGINLKDSFAKIDNGEVFLYGSHISPYEFGNRYNHEPERIRKLLLNKKEILKISMKVKKDGYSLVPLGMFFYQGLVKVEIGLGKGKKLYDKRESIAKKSQERDMQRLMNR